MQNDDSVLVYSMWQSHQDTKHYRVLISHSNKSLTICYRPQTLCRLILLEKIIRDIYLRQPYFGTRSPFSVCLHLSQPLAVSITLLFSLRTPFQLPYLNESMQHLSFCVWLLSLNTISSISQQVLLAILMLLGLWMSLFWGRGKGYQL